METKRSKSKQSSVVSGSGSGSGRRSHERANDAPGADAPATLFGSGTMGDIPPTQRTVQIMEDDDGDDQPRRVETVEDLAREAALLGQTSSAKTFSSALSPTLSSTMKSGLSSTVLKLSALGKRGWVQVLIYQLALAGVIFVLLATAFELGVGDSGASGDSSASGASGGSGAGYHGHDSSGHSGGDMHGGHGDMHGDHRRLGGETPPLLKHIAYCLVCSGMVAYASYLVNVPLCLGYLIGGVLVGPMALHMVPAPEDMYEISTLGSFFLLFLIGLELDCKALLVAERVGLVTGFLQYPVNAALIFSITQALTSIGLDFGETVFAPAYIGLCCSMSSTMLIVKLLSEQGDEDRPNGRLTIAVSFCQDIWAVIVLAIQPTLKAPGVGEILRILGMVIFLSVVAFSYAKFVMPAVLFYAKNSVELMLVLALAWCFFMCCTAVQPWVDLSMEIASLIAGASLGAFPFSDDFNSKVKYIRDFFATLFFGWIGMQIPLDTLGGCLGKAILLSIIILAIRWVSIYLLVVTLGGGGRLGALATINLSQMSEIGLVITMLGLKFGQLGEETSTILILVFCILTALTPLMISCNHHIYRLGAAGFRALNHVKRDLLEQFGCSEENTDEASSDHSEDEEGPEEDTRKVLLLGFHKIAFMLVAEFEHKCPEFLKKIHVLYESNADVMPKLREKGVRCTSCDVSSPSDISEKITSIPDIVISSTPDLQLQGVTNKRLLLIMNELFPSSIKIVTADNPEQSKEQYADGADYVLRSAKLVAERLHELLKQYLNAGGGAELAGLFEQFKKRDKDSKRSSFLRLKL